MGDWSPFDARYFRQDGEKRGPFSTRQLRVLVAEGTLSPRQAVWREGRCRLVFVPAATAAADGPAPSRRPRSE